MIRKYDLLISEDQFALIVRNRYGDDGGSVVTHLASERPDKRRAEVMSLVATVVGWAMEEGITIAIEDGKPVVRG